MALLMTNADVKKRTEEFVQPAMTQEIPYVIKIECYTGLKKSYHQTD